MRIAQVSPLHESVPPKLYGGTERVVHFLTEALVDLGHDVTLFASGDSKTRAELVACAPEALRLDPRCNDPTAHHVRMLEDVFARASDFDVIHFHVDYVHFGLARRLRGAARDDDSTDVWTFPIWRRCSTRSRTSRWCRSRTRSASRCPSANWRATVYHGLPPELYSLRPGAGGYLAFLGRVSPEKRLDRAIDIAMRLGMPLKIAAKVDKKDRGILRDKDQTDADRPAIEFVGEIGEAQKNDFPGRRRGAAVSGRLARAVRAGDDRGDGVRYAGGRVPLRLGAGGDARRGLGIRRRHARRGGRGDARASSSCRRPACRKYFEGASWRAGWRRDYLEVYGAGRGRAPPQWAGRTAIGLAAIDDDMTATWPATGATPSETDWGWTARWPLQSP